MRKVILHSITHFTIYNFRLPLIKELQARGIEVLALGKPDDYTSLLEKEGVRCLDSKISIDGMNPVVELKYISHLMKIAKQEKPDMIHHFSPKPVLFGSLAFGLACRAVNIASVTGLGHVYNLKKTHPARIISNILYKISNLFIKKYIFINIDDMKQMVRSGLVPKRKAAFICSEGVDIEKYYSERHSGGDGDNRIIFTFIGRLLYEKGIKEFIDAGAVITAKYPEAEFWIIGDTDYDNPSCMDRATLDDLLKGHDRIVYQGKVFDVGEYLDKTAVYVAPTYYREGVPRGILEAMAYRKPVITTNSVGARHTVRNGYNGYLIEPRSVPALVEAIEKIMHDDLARLGEHSYIRILKVFNVSKVNAKILKLYDKICN